jgi:hypothetical protein
MRATEKLLPNWDKACQDSKGATAFRTRAATRDALPAPLHRHRPPAAGPLGTYTGALCDPSWMLAHILTLDHLVDGVMIRGDPKLEYDLGPYGLVFEPQPTQVFFVIEDAELARTFGAEPEPGRALLAHIGEAMGWGADYLIEKYRSENLPPNTPLVRLGWERGKLRWGTAPIEHRTAIVRVGSPFDRSLLKKAKIAGVRMEFGTIYNNDAFENLDAFVLHNIVATGTKNDKMGTQAQICFHLRAMRHSPHTCFPYMFYMGDDDYTTNAAHARTAPLGNAPDKYPTIYAALADTCFSPFKLADGRRITFCGPHIPDYKGGGTQSGYATGPRGDQASLLDMSTNADRAVHPGELESCPAPPEPPPVLVSDFL